MNTIRIEKYQKGQETAIYELIKKVYDEFVSVDYSDKGNQFFYDWIQPLKIAERQRDQININLAWKGQELVGMIEMRENKYVSLLFVDKTHHRQGIAKMLFHESVKDINQKYPAIDKLYVHASPYSVPVYKRLGFVETDIMLEENGIRYLPMEIVIKK